MINSLLDASSVLSSVLGVVLAVLILLAMVTVHEFGHYLAGKRLGFKINEFSVGFGPALFKRRAKSGELFAVRLLPLGGYCAFEDENGLEGEENKNTPPTPEVKEAFPEFSASVSAAGTEQKTEGKAGEKTTEKAKADNAGGSGKRFCDQPPWKRILVLLAGAAMNYLLALVCIVISFTAFGQLMTMTYQVEENPAYAAEVSFQNEDVILKAEGKDVYTVTDLMERLKDRKEGDEAKFLVSRVVGKREDGKNIREEKEITVKLRAATNFENSADSDRLWQALGLAKRTNEQGNVIVDENGSPEYMVYSTQYRLGFFRALGRSFVYSGKIAGSIFKVLGELVTGALGVDTLGGPVTTIALTSRIAARGAQPFLEIAAYIGVNLAVFNLLPLPALDGSKIVFTAIEWVRGKPVNRKVEAAIHALGLVLLFAFAVLVDILQFL